jgi:hypothetical protein
LPYRAGRGIARVRKERLAGPAQALVERGEISAAHEHLAAQRQECGYRDRAVSQAQRQRANSPDVRRDILTSLTIAARRRGRQLAPLEDHFNG